MRKVVAHCPECNKVCAMAVADTVDEMSEAAKSAKTWERNGLKTAIIDHNETDPMPEWCKGH